MKKHSTLGRYAQVVGAGLLLLGGAYMLGVGTTSPVVDLDHLFVGGLLAYAGFRCQDEEARTIVGGMGLLYLLAGLLVFVVPALFRIFSDRPNGILLNHLVHLVFGISNVVAAVFLGQRPLAERLRRRVK